MYSDFITELKHELRLPGAREAGRVLLCVFGIGIALLVLQSLLRPLIDARFALDSVTFPLAMRSVEKAGSYWNLVGWGYFLNDHHVDSISRWLLDLAVGFAIVLAFSRLLWWGPMVAQAGAVANLLEWQLTGHVLDWIIFPNGALGVRALSLGDIAIYGGLLVTLAALIAMCVRLLLKWWSALRQVARAIRAQS